MSNTNKKKQIFIWLSNNNKNLLLLDNFYKLLIYILLYFLGKNKPFLVILYE